MPRRSLIRQISRFHFSASQEDQLRNTEEPYRPSYFDQPVKKFNKLQLIPHFFLGATFVVLGKLHLLVIPMVTIPLHYYVVMGGVYDGLNSFNLHKAHDLSLDIEETQAFYKIKEIMESHEAMQKIITKQNLHLYAPYTFPNPVKENHIIESFDIKTRRFRLRCKFQDKAMKTQGEVLSEVLHIPGNEIYIEKLTVSVKAPLQQTLKLVELHQHNDEEMMLKLEKYHKKMIEHVEGFTPDKLYEMMAEGQVFPKGRK